jgi:hypothetical protein
MLERRNLKRRHLLFYLRVFDASNGKILGHLVDISQEGIMLISERPIASGHSFALEMDIPTGTDSSSRVQFTARSIWSKKDINPNFFDTGFKILEMEPNCSEIITGLIELFGFSD